MHCQPSQPGPGFSTRPKVPREPFAVRRSNILRPSYLPSKYDVISTSSLFPFFRLTSVFVTPHLERNLFPEHVNNKRSTYV